jgi:autotransporter-associated beta strand protein
MTGGSQTIAGLNSTDGNGSKVVLGNGVLTLANTVNSNFDGVISGAGGSLVIQGPGKQVFTGANTYNGGTKISGGTLQLGDGSTKNGSVSGNITNNSALVFANPLSQTYTGIVSGNGPLTKTGTGTLTLQTAQTYSGATFVNNGVLRLGAGNASQLVSGFGTDTNGSTSGTVSNGSWTFNTGAAIATTPVNGGTLTLSDGTNQVRSAFCNSPVAINAPFTVSFTYKPAPGATYRADGMVFVLQNDSRGAAAIGTGGGQLGWGSPGTINPSAGVEFNIFSYSGGPSLGTYYATNGQLPASQQYNATGSVSLQSGDPIQVVLTYDGSSSINLSLQDLSTTSTYSTSYSTSGSLVSSVSGNTAFVGFTGATGGGDSVQTITNFSFLSGAGGGNILPVTTDLSIASGGTLDLYGAPQRVASLSGAGVITNSVSASTTTLSNSGSIATVFTGSINDGAGKVGVRVSSGTLTLSGTGTYTGGTTVNGGTLIITNSAAIYDNSSLSVGDPTLLTLLPDAPVPSSAAAVPSAVAAPSAVPEPGTLALVGCGAVAAAGIARRARSRRRTS